MCQGLQQEAGCIVVLQVPAHTGLTEEGHQEEDCTETKCPLAAEVVRTC